MLRTSKAERVWFANLEKPEPLRLEKSTKAIKANHPRFVSMSAGSQWKGFQHVALERRSGSSFHPC